MSTATSPEHSGRTDGLLLTAAAAAVAVVSAALVMITGSAKFDIYMGLLESSGALYVLPLAAMGGLLAIVRWPRLALYALAFLLPFNYVGGDWGSSTVVIAAKILVNGLFCVTVLTTFLAPREARAWLGRTRLGRALVYWLLIEVMAVAIGFVSAPDRGDWIRESNWMLFFALALPVGTLLRDRAAVRQLLGWSLAGTVAVQFYAFYYVAYGTRYTRADGWAGGDSFIRAPYSPEALLFVYFGAAALLYYSAARVAGTGKRMLAAATIALLGAGLLASMVRSMWLTGALCFGLVFALCPWNRRTARAAVATVGGVMLAIVLVGLFDNLSPSSNGQWTNNAIAFLADLGSKDSTSTVTRQLEWVNALERWRESPVVGLGWGYPFPAVTYDVSAAQIAADPFYIHNSFLNVLAKCGAVGLAAFLYLLARTTLSLATLRRRATDVDDLIFLTGVLAAVVQIAVLGLVTPSITTTDTVMYAGMLIGLVAVAERIAAADA